MLVTGTVPGSLLTGFPHAWRRGVDHIDRRHLNRFDAQGGSHDGPEPLIFIAGLAQADAFTMLAVGKLGLPMVAYLQCLLESLRYFVGELSVSPSWNAAALGDHLSLSIHRLD